MPFVLGATPTGTFSVAAGRIIINANGMYPVSFTTRETVGTLSTDVTDASAGTWTRANATVSFKDGEVGSTTVAQFTANTLTVAGEEFTLVFRK